MDTLVLVALNSKYIHSNTAVWYLHKALQDAGISSAVESFTIHDPTHRILRRILSHRPTLVCFSCYIWNMARIEELVSSLKAIDSGIKILLGGPEASFDSGNMLETIGADCILRGEGEDVIAEIACALLEGREPDFPGTVYLKNEMIHDRGYHIVAKLNQIASPFTHEMLSAEKDKILYYETSRGCLFRCIYCLSSLTRPIRTFPLERVFSDLEHILSHHPRQVKFVDRTFNWDGNRMREILRFLRKIGSGTHVHMEIHPAMLDEETLEELSHMPSGMIQVEGGIQSTNRRTLQASGRIQDTGKALRNMEKIIRRGNIRVHLDLLAGLPYETFDSFREAFNETMSVKPHILQVGFLKVLKGTQSRNLPGYAYGKIPPYEVLNTPWITYRELERLKILAECVDVFHNTGRFIRTLEYAQKLHDTPFDLFDRLGSWMQEQGWLDKSFAAATAFGFLYEFLYQNEEARECLRFDYLSCFDGKTIPGFLRTPADEDIREVLDRHLRDGAVSGSLKDRRVRSASVFHFAGEEKILLFDHGEKDPVTERCSWVEISL